MPRFVSENGTVKYKVNDKYHREDGPAIEFPDGEKQWLIHDMFHRECGPAIEGIEENVYWLWDRIYSKPEFDKRIDAMLKAPNQRFRRF